MEECSKMRKKEEKTNIKQISPKPNPRLDWPDGGGIMGSGATGRVERDLPITHGVSFNLLGGADGWSRKI